MLAMSVFCQTTRRLRLYEEQRSPSIAVERFADSVEPPHATVDAPSVATEWSAIDLDEQRASNNEVVRFGGDKWSRVPHSNHRLCIQS